MIKQRIKYYSSGVSKISLYQKPLNVGPKQFSFEKRINTPKGESIVIEDNIYRSLRRTKEKVIDLGLANKWSWFITLTFNPEKINSYDYSLCAKAVSKWLKKIKSNIAVDLQYIIIPELHEEGRIHYHALLNNIDFDYFTDSGKRDKKGRKIYNINVYDLGFTTATKVSDNIGSVLYISKYYQKDLMFLIGNKKRYWRSYNLNTPFIHYAEYGINQDDYRSLYYNAVSDFVFEQNIELENYTQNISNYIVKNEYVNLSQCFKEAYAIFGDIVKIKKEVF